MEDESLSGDDTEALMERPFDPNLINIIQNILGEKAERIQPLFTAKDREDDLNLNLFDIRLPTASEHFPALRAATWHQSPLLSFPARPPSTSPCVRRH